MLCKCCKVVETRDIEVCDECAVLYEAAKSALSIARHIGVPKYGHSSWREATDHVDHAATHVYMYKRQDTNEDHLAHAICRLVMELACVTAASS